MCTGVPVFRTRMFLGLLDPFIIDFFDFFSSKIYVYVPSNSIKQITFSLFLKSRKTFAAPGAPLGLVYRYLWGIPVPVPSLRCLNCFFLTLFNINFDSVILIRVQLCVLLMLNYLIIRYKCTCFCKKREIMASKPWLLLKGRYCSAIRTGGREQSFLIHSNNWRHGKLFFKF